jgi:L-iditol 2-dehydrogenase
MSEYFKMIARHVHRLSDSVSYEEAVLVEPLSCAIHILNNASFEIGSSVAVFGAGPIGLLLVGVLKLFGSREVICTDILPYRAELARRMGADLAISQGERDPVQEILKKTNGRGVDIAVDAAGTDNSYEWCLEVVRKKGKVMALGMAGTEARLNLGRVIYREVSVIGCSAYSTENDAAMRLLERKELSIGHLLTHKFELCKAQEAFETATNQESKCVKVVLINH